MVWGCLRKISCAEAPPEHQKPRLSWDDVTRRNLGNQERDAPFPLDLAGTGRMEGCSEFNPVAAPIRQYQTPIRLRA